MAKEKGKNFEVLHKTKIAARNYLLNMKRAIWAWGVVLIEKPKTHDP
jgi:hypothetical protein